MKNGASSIFIWLIHQGENMNPPSSTDARHNDGTRARVIATLEEAAKDLYSADYSIEAWRRGDDRALPGTLGRVRSRVMRALELLKEDKVSK